MMTIADLYQANHEVLTPLYHAGFRAEIWHTGGGCFNYSVPLTEAGLSGPFAYMGFARPAANVEWHGPSGVSVMAHRADGQMEWVGDYDRECIPCAQLCRIERLINESVPVCSTADEMAGWMVTIAKLLARAVTQHHH
jgi:hypothetical protein